MPAIVPEFSPEAFSFEFADSIKKWREAIKPKRKVPLATAKPAAAQTVTPAAPESASQTPPAFSLEIQQEYEQLALQEAQRQLKAIQAGKASQAGLFSLTKEIWQLQTELKHLEQTYPELRS